MTEQSPEVRRSSLPIRAYLQWAARNAELTAAAVGGLLVFGVVPPIPGVHGPDGRPADFQAFLLIGTVHVVRRAYRISRWVRLRRRSRRLQRGQ